jgi:putative transposase
LVERLEVAKTYVNQGHNVQKILSFSKINNSTWYKQRKLSHAGLKINNKGRPVPGYTVNPDGTIIPDAVILNALKDYRGQIDFTNAGGYQKLKYYLRNDFNFFVNHKKIYRLCKENSLLLPKHKKKRRKVGKVCSNRIVNTPNQLWEFDIKYGYIHGLNRHFFILIFMDVFTRKVMDYYIGLTCKAGDFKFTLKNALQRFCGCL